MLTSRQKLVLGSVLILLLGAVALAYMYRDTLGLTDPIAELEGGSYYVDLTRAPWSRVREKMNLLAQASGVVFDMRGYPKNSKGSTVQVVQHLAQDTVRTAPAKTPQLIYPDQNALVGYNPYRFTLTPNTPTIGGSVVFLTNARAISAADRLLGIVKHYDLATIVGQPTAGANGAVNPTDLIGNYQVIWTGQRVRKNDDPQHHLVGIRPDVEAEHTIEGIRNGRDEVLETALEVIRTADPDTSSGRDGTAPN